MAAFARFDLHLPTDDLFLRTELTHAEDHRIIAVEGGVAVSAAEPRSDDTTWLDKVLSQVRRR